MKISIITVVKNDERNIFSTLLSVKKQRYKNYEHIVIDGKSQDRTLSIIKTFKNKNLKYFSKKDKNLYQALNRGIKKSTGKYIGILHSGDKFFSNSILGIISKNIKNYDLLSGNVIFIKNKKKNRYWNYKVKKFNKQNAFKIAHTSLFVKRKILLKFKGYNENFKISSDSDLIIKMSKNENIKYKYLNKYITLMNYKGLSTSFKNIIMKVKEDLIIYIKHYNYLFIYNYLYKIIYKLIKLYN